MPPRDIDQRVNVTGDAEQKLGEIADAAKKVNDANEDGAVKTERAAEATDKATQANQASTRAHHEAGNATKRTGDEAETAADKQNMLGRAVSAVGGRIIALATGMLGFGGIISVYREWISNIDTASQRMREQIGIVRELAEARLNFVALQGIEDPQTLRQLEGAAAIAGRDPGEVFRLAGIFQSQFPNESPENIQELINQAVAAGQLTDAPLPELGRGLSVLFRETGNAQQAGNLLQEAIQQAGEEDPGRLAQEIGKFIGVGKQVGGLDTGEAAGFAAAATGLGLPNEQANTGLRNTIFAIRDTESNTPGNELLDRLGISREDPILALRQIAQANAEGNITEAQLITLAGREGSAVVSQLADSVKLQNFLASVQAVDAAEDFEGSIAAEKAQGIFEPGSIQSLNLLAKQAESATRSVRSRDTRAAEASAARAIIELELANQLSEGNLSPADEESILKEFDAQIGLGTRPAIAALRAGRLRAGPKTPRLPFGGQERINLTDPFVGDPTFSGIDRGDFLRDAVEQGLDLGPAIPNQPTTVIQNQTVNNGTIIQGTSDPIDGDFTGEDR